MEKPPKAIEFSVSTSKATTEVSPGATSTLLSNPCRDGDPTTALGSFARA